MPKISIPKIKMPSFNIREKLQKLRDKLKIPRRKGAKGEPSKFKFPPILKRLKALLKISKPPKAVVETKFRAEPLLTVIEGDIIDKYMIDQAVVFIVDRQGKGYYLIQEPPLTEEEQRIYSLLMENLFYSLLPTIKLPEDPIKYVESFIYEVAEDLGILELVHKSFSKYKYYITKDAFGYGPLHVLMNDPNVEEISCVSYGRPITVIHRKISQYDWLESNVVFASEDQVGKFVQKLAQKTGKSATVAIPFVDAMTPEGDRVAVTFSSEVTLPGSTFCMREGLIQLSDGELIEIKDLFDANKKEAQSETVLGNEILHINGKVNVIGVNPSTLTMKPASVKEIIKLKCPDKLVRVHIKEGEKTSAFIDVTEEHKFHVLTEKGLTLIAAQDLKRGGYLPVPVRVPYHGSTPNEEFKQAILSSLQKYEKNKGIVSIKVTDPIRRLIETATEKLGSARKTCLQFGWHEDYLYEAKKTKTGGISLSRLLDLLNRANLNLDINELYLVHRGCSPLKIPLKLSRELAYLIGWSVADGYFHKNYIQISIGPNQAFKTSVLQAFINCFNVSGSHYGRSDSSLFFKTSLLSRVLKEVFEVPSGPKARKVFIPKLLIKSENPLVSGFIQGLFEGDGTFGVELSYKSFSERLLKELQFVLARFGILALKTTKDKLSIPRSYQSTFLNEIGVSDEKLKMALKKRNGGLGRLGKVLPPFISDWIIEAAKKKGVNINQLLKETKVNLWAAKKPKSQKANLTLNKYLKLTKYLSVNFEELNPIVQGKYDLREITGVEFIENRDPVYDLVCNPEPFFIGGTLPLIIYDCIRKFPVEPLSMANLIKFNTISPLMAAYLWILVEHRGFILTIGPMSSGKTTMLNCLLTMISPNLKIVTVEDSVDGNMEILAIVAGKPVVTTIKELVDGVLDKKGFKTVDSGHEVGVSNEIEILTLDEKGKVTLQKPDRFIRHFVEKEGVLIRTATGRSIKTTIDHSLYSLDQTGALRPVQCKTLKPGDYLATLGQIPFNCEHVSFDLTTLDEIVERFSIDKNSMIRYPQARNFQSLPSKIELDEDLAFLCGVWLADGFYGERTVGFSTGYNNEVSRRMYRTAEKMGLRIKKHSDGTLLQIHSVIFKKVLHNFLELKGDDYNRRVPPLFFTTEKTVTANLLRGYFTCDGNVNRYEIETSSASPNLLKDIQSLLLRFGIVLRVNFQKRTIGAYGGIGVYRGRICGAKMLKRFKENIGFEDSLKNTKLIKACSNRTKPSVDPIPLTGNLTEVADAVKLLPKHRVKVRLNNALKRGYAYRDDLVTLGDLVPTFKGTKTHQLAESDVYFDRIVLAEPIKIKGEVYDLGVPQVERFICEGFICHNTPEIKIPHKNWERFKARRAYAITETKYDVDLFDLVKLSLRYRPDYISVGEIRGEEAKSLIQAASLGHGAVSTLHAESPTSAFIRLTTTPMEVEPGSLGLISAIVTLHRIRMPDGSVSRRVVDISEVVLDNEGKPQISNIFTRDPTTDEMCPSTAEEVLAKSKKLELLTGPAGWSQKKLLKQLKIRVKYLQELVEQEKTTYDLFSDAMFKFYSEVEKGAA